MQFNDWEFEDRLDQIALPVRERSSDFGRSAPGTVSLTLLVVGLVLGMVFFAAGFVLMFFCIGILVWYAGAAIMLVIHSIGAVSGLVAILINHGRPAHQITGGLGLVLNSAAAAGCAWLLANLFR